MKRRIFLANTTKAALATGTLSSVAAACGASGKADKAGKKQPLYPGSPSFVQRPLPYSYHALEPAIDALTMEIHYSKHAAAYAKNMAEALKDEAPNAGSLESIFAEMGKYTTKMRNNAGGHYNHERFWQWMTPGGKGISAGFAKTLSKQFGSTDEVKKQMLEAATKRFGSGWAWLLVTPENKLTIGSTPNQDNPLMSTSELRGYPILGVDVWEHAYYLKYQNKRADYLNAWWSLINWAEVENTYTFAFNK